MLAVPAADLHPQLAALHRVADGLDQAVVLVEQIAPLARLGRDPLQLPRGDVVGVVELERGLEHLERHVLVLQVMLGHLRGLLQALDLVVLLLEHLRPVEQQLDQRGPVLGVAEDRVERLVGGRVGGVVLQDLLVGARRLHLVLEPLLPDRRDLHEHVDLGVGVLEHLDLALEHGDGLVPAGLLRVEIFEGRQGLHVARRQL